jgi:hypothetical protein
VSTSDLATRLLRERNDLAVQVSSQRDQLERMRSIVDDLEARLAHDEHLLGELEGVLGLASQLRLESLDERLRGQRLEQIALAVLLEERGDGCVVHYRDWFALLRARGHHIAGKDPLGTFLTQINRCSSVERVGRRTGQYRVHAVPRPCEVTAA